jgi:hypothetical protein
MLKLEIVQPAISGSDAGGTDDIGSTEKLGLCLQFEGFEIRLVFG